MTEDSDFYREFKGKEVVIFLENGYKKFCEVVSFNGSFVKIRFNTGREELVAYSTIESIKFRDPSRMPNAKEDFRSVEYGKQKQR